jgi:hypothetical protein
MNDSIIERLKRINFGAYNDRNVTSVGGHIGSYGAAVGYDKKKKKIFGSANKRGKKIGSFGPQE